MNRKSLYLLSFFLIFSTPISSQTPRTYFIKDIKIVSVASPVIEKGSVLIADGLIISVGVDLKVPLNAQIINGDKLTIYPGFFDAYNDVSSLSTPTPPPTVNVRGGASQVITGPSDRPSSYSHLVLAEDLRLDEKKLEAWRNGGFTHMHLVAKNGLIASRSTIVSTAPDYSDASLVKAEAAIPLGFSSSGRDFASFPNSLMGSISYLRQTFMDLTHYEKQKDAYLKNPNGLIRPQYDKTLEGLSIAKANKLPLVIPVNTNVQISRSIDLASSFGFNYLLQGVQEGYQAASLMANAKISALVSVKWPTEDTNVNPEIEPNLRTLRFRDRAPSTPSVFEKSYIPFAFSGDGIASTKDFMAGVKLAIDKGLSKEAAVNAMTLGAARLMGIQAMVGSIEKGKIANLVITDGEPWESKTKIKMVFIDGVRFDIPEPPPVERPNPRPTQQPGADSL